MKGFDMKAYDAHWTETFDAAETRNCVLRGMALLDDRSPGWVDKIDLLKLDMKSLRDCVVGQLYGSFLGWQTELGFGPYQWALFSEHGFAQGLENKFANELQEIWKEEIEKRRE